MSEVKWRENDHVNSKEMVEARLLIDFINATKTGMTKPYDPIPVIQKIENYERDRGVKLTQIRDCCPQLSTVNDAKDFRPYILAALDRFMQLMNIQVENQRY